MTSLLTITVDRNKIYDPLSLVVGITEKKSLMPQLSNARIHFGKKSYIQTTDLDISATAYIDLEVDEERSIVVNARKLFDVLREFEKGEMKLSIGDRSLIISQGSSEVNLALYDEEEFPEIKGVSSDVEFEISTRDLCESLESVAFAIGTDESRYVLTGVYMKGEEKTLSFVATDGYRMALKKMKMEDLPLFSGFVIPSKMVRELLRIFDEDDRIKIQIGKTVCGFSTDKIEITSRVIEGNYPDYESAIPRHNKLVVKVERDSLHKALRKVSSIVSKNEPFLLRLAHNSLEIISQSDLESVRVFLDVAYDGEKKEIHLNGKFLIDAVSHTKGEFLTLKLPGEYGAILIEGEKDDYLNVIMPIRV